MKKEKKPVVTVQTTVEVPIKRLQDLLCTGFEGGMASWCVIDNKIKPKKIVNRFDDDQAYPLYDYPANVGGSVKFIDIYAECEEGNEPPHNLMGHYFFKGWKPKTKKYTLNLAALKRGIELMARKYPQHFADFMAENDDAVTGDVFIQLCVLGDVIYG